jgi:hypothetical protein
VLWYATAPYSSIGLSRYCSGLHTVVCEFRNALLGVSTFPKIIVQGLILLQVAPSGVVIDSRRF